VLVVDQDADTLACFGRTLEADAWPLLLRSPHEALEILRSGPSFDLIVCGDPLLEVEATTLLAESRQLAPTAVRILMGRSLEPALLRRAINQAQIHYVLEKPVGSEEIRELFLKRLTLRSPAAGSEPSRAGRPPAVAQEPPAVSPRIVWRSKAMRGLIEMIERVGPLDCTVLIQGETGTGKELVARALHQLSPRRNGPFMAVNCAALSESLIESELFGHERGAFTGATQRRIGRFEAANGGTLFIDEFGDIPLSTQAKLLRVLQERTVERVGSSRGVLVDVRLVAATHRDLEAAVESGAFRRDLFYRLNVVPLRLPPLRERTEDVALLAEHFLDRAQQRSSKSGLTIGPAALAALEGHLWPGNVRELENLIERMVALLPSGGEITPELLGLSRWRPRQTPPRGVQTLRDHVAAEERRVIADALDRHRGNRTKAARELGLTRQGLSQKIAKYGIGRH
jgi:DNA-binding NtrC family response regulator